MLFRSGKNLTVKIHLWQVRLFTAKKIHYQLEQARTEFIQANVTVKKQALMLPKVLHYYAKDAALELRHLVELVCETTRITVSTNQALGISSVPNQRRSTSTESDTRQTRLSPNLPLSSSRPGHVSDPLSHGLSNWVRQIGRASCRERVYVLV